MRRLIAFVLSLFVVLSARFAWAEPPRDCGTPRRAVESVFAWQQAARHDPAKAAMCLDAPGKTRAERAEIAQHIKTLYDARALYVRMNAISDDPAWVDPNTGVAQVVPHEGLKGVVVERQSDGQWRWSEASLDHLEALYAADYSVIERHVVPYLPRALKSDVFGIHLWQYLGLLVLVAVAVLARSLIRFIVKGRVKHLVEHLGQKWAARFVDVFASPGATLLMAGMLRVGGPMLRMPLDVALVLSFVVRLLIVVSLVLAAYRLVEVVAERMAAKAEITNSRLDDQLVPLVRKSLKGLTLVAGTLLVLQNLGIDVGSLVAGLGIGGVAIALAAKDTIANFFGSVMIFIDQPFQIGDYVSVAGVEGTVEEVGFRSTRIRTPHVSLVTVPNAKFTEANIDNLGRRTYRRVSVTLSLTYDTTVEQIEAFCEGLRGIVLANRSTSKDRYQVHFSGVTPQSLEVMLVFFLQVETWSREFEERHNLLLEVLRLAETVGVRFVGPVSPADARRKTPVFEELSAAVRAFAPEGERSRPVPPTFTDGAYLPSGRQTSVP